MPVNLMSAAAHMLRFGTITLKSRNMSPKPGFYQLRVELTKDEFNRYGSLLTDDTKQDAFKTDVQLDYNPHFTPPFIAGEPGRQQPPTTKAQLRELAQLLMAVKPNVLLSPSDGAKADFDRQFYQGIALFMSLVAHLAIGQLPDPPPPEPATTTEEAVTLPPPDPNPEPTIHSAEAGVDEHD